jgi:hypothetical protein
VALWFPARTSSARRYATPVEPSPFLRFSVSFCSLRALRDSKSLLSFFSRARALHGAGVSIMQR